MSTPLCNAPSFVNASKLSPDTYPFDRPWENLNEVVAFSDPMAEEDAGKPLALVVDDAPDVTEMVATFLRYSGYEVVQAYSGPEALDAAQSHSFDVVISDIGMPGMDGYQLAQALRALPRYDAVPIIAVTGFSMYDDQGRSLRAGFNAHLTKPINPMLLLEAIQRLRS